MLGPMLNSHGAWTCLYSPSGKIGQVLLPFLVQNKIQAGFENFPRATLLPMYYHAYLSMFFADTGFVNSLFTMEIELVVSNMHPQKPKPI